jgi:hypothetical protein
LWMEDVFHHGPVWLALCGGMTDPPEPYWQAGKRLFADKGGDHVARLLAYALRDLDKAQGKA